jgi:predicted DCC family thiol-disulfide oxidoreductase YuxK
VTTTAEAEVPGGWRYLVLYDGECGLCDRSVQWLLRRDRRAVLRFAPLQGETARGFVGEKAEFDTMVFVERRPGEAPRVLERARAVLTILRRIGGVWLLVAWLRFLPRVLIDVPYRFVARRRIRWFGRVDACRLPDPATRQRFLP